MKNIKAIPFILIQVVIFNYCSSGHKPDAKIKEVENHKIMVDGNTADWESIQPFVLESEDYLWIGEGLPEGRWKGRQDLSLSWKIAWHEQKIYFLFEVTDDILSNFDQEFTWMNDCIEIHLDPENLGGNRIPGISEEDPLELRLGKESYGYEMHILPMQLPRMYLDDTYQIFYKDSAQNEIFFHQWDGEIRTKYKDDGYVVEVGFNFPAADGGEGKIFGLDIALCDDDGKGREKLMLWSTYKGAFWITMDDFIKMRLQSK
ncbi:MAG: hypothetical protein IH594_08020 [Bacteroidales bacterium]|nr:hypothetical protein [Bacteroidales bacterium]